MDMDGIGNFTLEVDDDLQNVIDFNDPEFDFLLSTDIATNATEISCNKFLSELKKSEDPGLPPPGQPSAKTEQTDCKQRKRFKTVVDEQTIKNFQGMNQSTSTKKNTRWGMKILQDWHTEAYGHPMDLENLKPTEIADKLSKFYCEATPQENEKKTVTGGLYHKNTLKNIRAAINRHLSDLNRNIDIVHDREFKHANSTLNGLMKERVVSGTSRPTQHKEIIPQQDLQKISAYLEKAYNNPVNLRLCTWYILSIHFVTRGLEWHHQLTRNAFEIKVDENGHEFVCLTHETRQKNYQGGITSDEYNADKRMYATLTENCPVKILKHFMQRTPENATHLFNRIDKFAMEHPDCCDTWYTASPLGKSSFTNFLPDISKMAGCSKRYTAHCLRATTIQAMSDAGIETRQIMFMSGHRNEASVRSYSRDCSTHQKHKLSAILSATASGHDVTETNDHAKSSLVTCDPNVPTQIDVSNSLSSVQSGFLTNSTFSNCNVTINMKM